MIKNLISAYKKGAISNYYKSKDFQKSKRQFSLYLTLGESVAYATLEAGMIPYDEEVVVVEFM